MGALSKILRSLEGGRLAFHCPGCNCTHQVQVGGGPGPRWGWNGDAERPTFTPSIMIRTGHFASQYKPGDDCWCTYNAKNPKRPSHSACVVCHSFVTDGRIQFLGDSTHALSGQTVDLPAWPHETD